MQADTKLKEQKSHGSPDYTFEIYRKRRKAAFFITNHWHDETEIIHILKGNTEISINNISYSGTAGNIFIINKNEMHEIYSEDTDLQYNAFVFDANMLSFAAKDFSELNFIEPLNNRQIIFRNKTELLPEANKLLARIDTLNTEQSAAYRLRTKAALLELIGIFIENGLYTRRELNPAEEEKSLLLKKIVTYINENCASTISLSEIAHEFNMSAKYFCRFFKKNFNKTFIEYLNGIRTERAVKLLYDKTLSITEIAMDCGFSNMSYFTRTFKSIIGITPSAYRKTHL